jgi:geranylgeranyl diphosphate synthase type I
MTAPVEDDAFRARVDAALATFADGKRAELVAISPDLTTFADAAIDFIAGGKRLRPLFCRAGWLVGGGGTDVTAFDDAAASLEWLLGSALAHDDLMDGSDTRRGRPSLHRKFEGLHEKDGLLGSAERHGGHPSRTPGTALTSTWISMPGSSIFSTASPRTSSFRSSRWGECRAGRFRCSNRWRTTS